MPSTSSTLRPPHRVLYSLAATCTALALGLGGATGAEARPGDDDRHGPGNPHHGKPHKHDKHYKHDKHDKHYKKGPPHDVRGAHDERGWGPPPHAPAYGVRHGAGPHHDWYRGGRVPAMYRTPHYVVADWRGHHLKAPPRGYHWVQYGGDYLLVAIATGVIAQLVLSGR